MKEGYGVQEGKMSFNGLWKLGMPFRGITKEAIEKGKQPLIHQKTIKNKKVPKVPKRRFSCVNGEEGELDEQPEEDDNH